MDGTVHTTCIFASKKTSYSVITNSWTAFGVVNQKLGRPSDNLVKGSVLARHVCMLIMEVSYGSAASNTDTMMSFVGRRNPGMTAARQASRTLSLILGTQKERHNHAMQSKQRYHPHSPGNVHTQTPFVPLVRRSDLFGSVQGTAHITYSKVSMRPSILSRTHSPRPRYTPRSTRRIRSDNTAPHSSFGIEEWHSSLPEAATRFWSLGFCVCVFQRPILVAIRMRDLAMRLRR